MSSSIDVLFLEESCRNLTIADVAVDLFGDKLKKLPVSSNYAMRCPFHTERTPSFYVKPKLNHAQCYGCGVREGPFSLPFRAYLCYPHGSLVIHENGTPNLLAPITAEHPFSYFHRKIRLDPTDTTLMSIFARFLREDCRLIHGSLQHYQELTREFEKLMVSE